MAADFDVGFYSRAPADQQLAEFFAGDEAFRIEGMHPSEPALSGKLEPLVVRAFATQRTPPGRNRSNIRRNRSSALLVITLS